MADFPRPRFLPNGDIVYPKRGWEPPPPIEGYERSPKDQWRFVPKWKECRHRMSIKRNRPCGAVKILSICNCEGCPRLRSQVTLKDCAECPFRQDRE